MFSKVKGQVEDGKRVYRMSHEGLNLKITELEPSCELKEDKEKFILIRFANLTLKLEVEGEYKNTVRHNWCYDVELSLGSINVDIYAGDDRWCKNSFKEGLMLGARNSIHYGDVLIEVNAV